MENKIAITTQEDTNNPASLLKLAIESKADIQQLEKLMELQERFQKTQSVKAFNSAMSNFQKDCPEIKKTAIVKGKDGKVRYKFAPIGEIAKQIKKPLSENNLFYDFLTENTKEEMKITCTVTHEKGHSKSSHFCLPIGNEEYMTESQKYGARRTFAMRYALCNALGITTADDDVDANEEKAKENQTVQPAPVEKKNENAFTPKDEERVLKALGKCTTEKKVIDVFYDFPEYQNNIVFKAMIQKRTSEILPACKFTSDKERKQYHFEKKKALMKK